MNFQQNLQSLVNKCKEFQQKVNELKLWYTPPIQKRYVLVTHFIQAHIRNKLELEALAAGDQAAPGYDSLTPARKLFYELQIELPPFLASGSTAFYYLQRYYMDCIHLLKTFSYSDYEEDWKKQRELISWLGALQGMKESHDASGSLNKSLDDIKRLGNIATISNADLRFLEEEVRNIQAVLIDAPDLENQLTEADLLFIQQATAHLEKNKHLLKGIPELDNSFKYDEPPALGVVSDRCRQLAVLVDNFKYDFDPEHIILDMDQFKKDLRGSFDLNIDICEDVYQDIMGEFGAFKIFSLRKLCDSMHNSFVRFSDSKYLQQRYPNGVRARHTDVYTGMADNITIETYLLLAVGAL